MKGNITLSIILSCLDFLLVYFCRYAVDLLSDGVNVGDALVSEGLVSTCGASQIEMNILAGQQLRATLMEVTSLSSFKIFIAPDLTLPCIAHNLSTAQEEFLEKLNQYLNTEIIVYVDDVVKDQ